MKRIYLATDLGSKNNWNRLHGKPMRRRSHVNILASRRLDAERKPYEPKKLYILGDDVEIIIHD